MINSNLLWLMGGTFAALAVGSGLRLVALRNSPADIVQQRLGSLKVWWLLALLWSVAVLAGNWGVAFLLAVASALGLREYMRFLGTTTQIGRPAIVGLFVLGSLHYGLIVGGASQLARPLFPIAALIILAAVRVATCGTKDYIRVTAGLYWGAMLLIYGLSHILFLFEIDATVEPMVGATGWILYLVLLTEMNDIMQAIVGRRLGKRQITPQISPHKTLEGLLGGVVSTVILALLLAPYLTTMTMERTELEGWLMCVAAGVLISLAGYCGDINMSAIKRDAGVKDGSSLLPGMGGIIDRIDSMTFTAPVFYYFVIWTSPICPSS